MKDTLKKIYKSNLVESVSTYDFDHYYYFIGEDDVFGILKKCVSDNELKLILSQYELLSEEWGYQKHQKLMDFLFGNQKDIVDMEVIKYYFIKFMNIHDEDIYKDLNQLLSELFNERTYFIKKHNIYMIIVEGDMDIQFIDVLKSIEGDFFIQIIGFESDIYDVNLNLPKYFQFDFKAFQSYQKTDQLIIHKTDLLQNNLLSIMNQQLKDEIKTYILKDYIQDKEMLNVIKTYFKTNFNSTLAAKKCYMHRNTFINKIDKFIGQTHFNLRRYDEAFIVYLALVM